MLLRPRGEGWALGHHSTGGTLLKWLSDASPVCPPRAVRSRPRAQASTGSCVTMFRGGLGSWYSWKLITEFGSFSLNYLLELSAWPPALAPRAVMHSHRRGSPAGKSLHQPLTSVSKGRRRRTWILTCIFHFMYQMKQTSYEENTSAFKNLKIKPPQHRWTNGKSGLSMCRKQGEGKYPDSLCISHESGDAENTRVSLVEFL